MTPTMEQIKEWMTDAGISHLSEPLERFAALAFAAGQSSNDARPCTCHPDDNPPKPCPRKYALSECRAAASGSGAELVRRGGVMKPLCIYHGNCADGFGAAWVFKRYADREFDFHAGVYQNDPPDVTGKDVYLVDFSYKRSVVARMREQATRLVLIDHHKTAIDDLAPLIEAKQIEALVSLENSGAMLAWRWFHGYHDDEIPRLLRHIEDRDLWRFALHRTREIQACVFSHPYDFAVWDELMQTDPQKLAEEGAAIERKHHKDIAELTKVCTRNFTIGGYAVPVANLPYTLTSDAGHLLAQGKPFAGCYWDTPEGRVFSLRSTDEGLDVSEIAKQYGGGGHKHASGFRVPYGHELAR